MILLIIFYNNNFIILHWVGQCGCLQHQAGQQEGFTAFKAQPCKNLLCSQGRPPLLPSHPTSMAHREGLKVCGS